MDCFQDGQRVRKKEKKKGTERDGKGRKVSARSLRRKRPKSFMSGFLVASARIQTKIPPCWRKAMHGGIYPKKGGYLLSRFAGSTIGVSGLNFSVRNGKRWDTAAIATIISDSGIHAAQHHFEEGRIIPLTSNQQNIKKQTKMYMKKHPCEKKYRVPRQKLSGY